MKKENSGLLLLGGLGLLGYLLYKGGVFNKSEAGAGTLEGGGTGWLDNLINSIFPGGLTSGAIPLDAGKISPPTTKQITIGLLSATPKIGTTQTYGYVGQTSGGYVQKTAQLITTPAMAYPPIVQARSIIQQTANIDVGKLVSSVPIARKTYSSTPTKTTPTYAINPIVAKLPLTTTQKSILSVVNTTLKR